MRGIKTSNKHVDEEKKKNKKTTTKINKVTENFKSVKDKATNLKVIKKVRKC